MFAIYLTIPFVFLASAIALVPLWRTPTYPRRSDHHASMDSIRGRRSDESVGACAGAASTLDAGPEPCTIHARLSTLPSKGDPQRDTSALSSGV
jgi:hypothetical protein